MVAGPVFTAVHVALPNHWGASGEAIPARPLGGDMYELQAPPVYAYDLNRYDVVRATADQPGFVPEVREVVHRSGHTTLRLLFFEVVPAARRAALIGSLTPAFESVRDRYFVLDLTPESDSVRIRAQLDAWEADGWIEYETCEAKQPGTFDDVPPAAD